MWIRPLNPKKQSMDIMENVKEDIQEKNKHIRNIDTKGFDEYIRKYRIIKVKHMKSNGNRG